MDSLNSSCKQILDNLFDGVYCLDTNKQLLFGIGAQS